MTREEAKEYLINISYQLGTMGMEYLSDKDGIKMREAIKILEQESCDCNADGVIFNYLGWRYICKNPVMKTIDSKGICSFYGFKRG